MRKLTSSLRILIRRDFSYRKPNKPWYNPDTHKANRQKSGYLHIGMYGFVFAACFATIPLYRLFCEHIGLSGNYDKKEYTFEDKKFNNMRKYRVVFRGEGQPGINWQFAPVQGEVQVGAAETAIVFYRIYNKEDYPIIGFSTYNVTPQNANTYFSKIQCFCFNQQLINPKEQLLLPLFFYLQPEINDDHNMQRINNIIIDYRFYKSSKQELAKHVERQLRQLQLNRRNLAKIRAKKQGISIEQYEQKHKQQTAAEIKLQELLASEDLSELNKAKPA